MNHIYRLVFNHSLGVMQAAPETTRTRRTGGGHGTATGPDRRPRRAVLAASVTLAAAITLSLASPTAAQAQSVWTGNASQDWFDPGNWHNGVPDADTDTTIDNTAPHATVVDGGDASAQMLMVGVGDLTIQGAGTMTSRLNFIGDYPNTSATVTVTGHESTWYTLDELHVGSSGAGWLTIVNGGTVDSASSWIGALPGGSGTATVTGGNSTWNLSGGLSVGSEGDGELIIADGGTVISASSDIGGSAGSSGTVTVTGSGSTWTSRGGLFVGFQGDGQLTIADGGAVGNLSSSIASHASSTSAVTVTGGGSIWFNYGQLRVGDNGEGELTIDHGGTVNNTDGVVGNNSGASGTVTVTGSDSTWNNNRWLYVGLYGDGRLTIADGGTVDNADAAIGNQAGSTGAVTVTGGGSTWNNSRQLRVGDNGHGELIIDQGGTVNNTNGGLVGFASDASGAVTVTGSNSTWNNSDTLHVGERGTGELTIADGGAVGNQAAAIGVWAGSSGTVRVTGSDSTWNNSRTLSVGERGTGELTIADGGMVTAAGGVQLGWNGSSTGTLNIGAAKGDSATAAGFLDTSSLRFANGNATLVFNHTDPGYAFTAAMQRNGGGNHAIEHLAGTTTLAADSAAFSGLTTVSGGMLQVADALGGSARVQGGRLQIDGTFGGNIDVQADGTLAGAGNVAGDVGFDGGTLAGVQGQTLTISGDLALADDTRVHVALGGTPSSALFDVGGDLTLDGTLHVADAGGFGPGVYRLFDYGGALDGAGMTVDTAPGGIDINALSVQTAVAGQVSLVSTAGAELGFWDSGNAARHDNNAIDGGDGAWRADGRNWTTADGAVNGPYRPNPTFAVFAGNAGVVTVDASAGDIAATGLQFASDGYRIQGDAITLSGNGGDRIIRVGDGSAAGAAFTATIAADLTGTQGLVKADHGTLVLTGNNAYGDTRVEAGTLVGSVASLSGDIANAGTVVFEQGADGDYSGGIGGFAGRRGDMVKRGAGTLTLAGASSLDWTIQDGGLFSATDRFGGNLAIGASGAFTFEQAHDGSYAGTIAGAGALAFTGGGTVRLTGDSIDFSGLTTIADSTLIVGGTFGGTLQVGDGGVLGGTGTVGTTTVGAGGTLAPGTSPGTLTVDGDLTLAAGSIYAVDAGPGSDSDLLAVAGQAFLQGGSVLHVGPAGNYAPSSTYTILTAAGGIDGTFGEVGSDFAFLEASLHYSADAVALTLERNHIGFDDIGQTGNQIATARGAESVGSGHGLYDALVRLEAGAARDAFDQLSGEAHAGARGALLDDARFLRDGIGRRLDGSAAAGTLHADGGATLWLSGAGRQGRTGADGNASEVRSHREGLMFGADLALGERVRLGAVLGSNDVVQRNDGRASRIEADGLHLGLYVQADWDGLHLRGGATRSEYDVDTARHVAFEGLAERLSAGYDTRATTVFAEGGYRIGDGAAALTPYLGVAHVRLETDAAQEHGGDSALWLSSSKDEVLTATLGLRGHRNLGAGGADRARLHAGLGWQHAWGDLKADSRAHFAGGEAFTVSGLPLARNSVVVDLGVELSPSARSRLGLGMHGRTGDDQREYGVQLDWRVTF